MAVTAPATPAWSPLPGAHYLHPMKSTRVPRRWVFIDTEAHREARGGGEEQSWRLGVSATVKWRPDTERWSPPAFQRHQTPESLWERVTGYARKDARTVVVAHNLGYDLRIGRAFELLPVLGWSVGKLTLSGEHIGCDLSRDSRTLVLVDSLTVLPRKLADLGSWLGIGKPALPDDDDSEAAWWARCETDVAILAKAYMTVVEWVRSGDLGCWARTGAGLGWNTILRKHLKARVLVHARDDLRELEATSCYANRAEAWRVGELHQGPYTEWDYHLSYASILAEHPLPTIYRDEVRGVTLDRMLSHSETTAFLCRAKISTETPCLPWKDQSGVCWPVGTFQGWWWAGELANARAHGASVQVSSAHRYSAERWLATWAEWVIAAVDDRSTPEARIRALAAKHWQRAVVGRSAMHFRSWEMRGDAWRPGCSYWDMLDLDTGQRGAALQLGSDRWEAWAEEWWDHALPQLLSAVMSHCRVTLWRTMLAAGLENLVAVDTDCVITNPAGSTRLTAAVERGGLGRLRPEGRHPWLSVRGPQYVVGSTWRKLAGVPIRAVETAPGHYKGERWQGIAETLASGAPGVVKVAPGEWDPDPHDWRRQHNPDGTTTPYRVKDGERIATS